VARFASKTDIKEFTMRDILRKTMALNESHTRTLDAHKGVLTERDLRSLKALRESSAFKAMEENERDRHLYRQILTGITIEPASYCDRLANRIDGLVSEGILNGNLEPVTALTEGMADVDSKDTQAKSQGMYGIGDGADKDEPSGDADNGADQDEEHGDSSKTASNGYLDEMDDVAAPEHNHVDENDDEDEDDIDENDDEDADDEMYAVDADEAFREEVQKDAPSADSDEERAANDATYKDGAMQNESKKRRRRVKESEDGQSGPITGDYKPKAEDPGEPKAGTSKDKAETPDADTPDYSKAKEEDPSNSELNKGPAKAVNESFGDIEKKVLAMLEVAGIKTGTPQFEELYQKAFSYAIEERAKSFSKKRKN
jgi:hypothetical protein